MLEAALEYAARGFPVFPIYGITPDGTCACGSPLCGKDAGKHPLKDIPWSRLVHTDPERVRAVWAAAERHVPALNYGVAVPDGFAVVDLDPRHDGWSALETWEAEHGKLPESMVTISGSDGLHFWVRTEPGKRLDGKLAPGLDIRQPGNYVVGAGSRHASGGTYRHAQFGDPVPHPAITALLRDPNERPTSADRPEADGLTDEQIDTLATALAEHMVDGSKHRLMFQLGGWLRQRELSEADAESLAASVLDARGASHGDVRDVDAGVQACRDGFNGREVHGWEELATLLEGGAPFAEWLDANTPSPWREARARDDAEIESWFTPRAAPAEASDVWSELGPPMPDDPGDPLVRLVDGLDIAAGYTTLVAAGAGCSKTPTALALALALANGVPWLGYETQQSTVVYLCWEKVNDVNRKRARIARSMGLRPGSVHMLDMRAKPLNSPEWKRGARSEVPMAIARLVEKFRADGSNVVVFVDTYGSAVRGIPHIEAAYAEPFQELSNWINGQGAAFVPLVHTRKSTRRNEAPTLDDIEGSMYLGAAVSACLSIYRPDPESKSTFQLHHTRELEDDMPSVDVRWVNDARGDNERWGLKIELAEPESRGAGETAVKLTQAARFNMVLERMRGAVRDGTISNEHDIGLADLSATLREDSQIVRRAVTFLAGDGVLVATKHQGAWRVRAPYVGERAPLAFPGHGPGEADSV